MDELNPRSAHLFASRLGGWRYRRVETAKQEDQIDRVMRSIRWLPRVGLINETPIHGRLGAFTKLNHLLDREQKLVIIDEVQRPKLARGRPIRVNVVRLLELVAMFSCDVKRADNVTDPH